MKNLSYKKIVEILASLEDKGLVFKTWDEKKMDYVWNQTPLGKKVVENMK